MLAVSKRYEFLTEFAICFCILAKGELCQKRDISFGCDMPLRGVKEFISYRMRTKRAYIAFAQQIYRTAQAVYRNEIIKPGCIANKTFAEMLDKLGYVISSLRM